MRELLTRINEELEKELEKKYQEAPDAESGLELGWCLLQDSRYCEGIQHALDMKDLMTPEKDAEYKGLMTKLYVEGAEHKKALKMAEIWEEALKKKIDSYSEEEKEEEKKKDIVPKVVLSTANPYKFPQDVLYALSGNDVKDSFKGIKRLNLLTAMKPPKSLLDLRYRPLRFKTVVENDLEKMSAEILKFADGYIVPVPDGGKK
jgi:hypothetical protein